jgi:hypothetical protein
MKFSKYLKKLKIAAEKYNQRRAEESASAFSLAIMSYSMLGPKMSLKQYLEMLNLKEIKPPKSKEELKKEANEAVKKSKNIISMMSRKRGD